MTFTRKRTSNFKRPLRRRFIKNVNRLVTQQRSGFNVPKQKRLRTTYQYNPLQTYVLPQRGLQITKQRERLGFSKYDVSLLQYSIYDSQFLQMATPSFSLLTPLTVVATGDAINQRGTDLTPTFKPCRIKLHVTQADAADINYRLIGVTLLDMFDLTTAPLPLQFFDNAPTTVNFGEVCYLTGPNRTIQFSVWYDSNVHWCTLPTGVKNRAFEHFIKVPGCRVKYSTAEHGLTGVMAKGHQLLLILTDAPHTNGSYLIDVSYKRHFLADGK